MINNGMYAIGEQDFKNLREDDALYIDKTAYIEKIIRNKSKYYFLARPRRFGKTLTDGIYDGIRDGRPDEMLKSLRAYFAGIPYDLKMDNENNFHNAFYILVTLIGLDAKAEAHTSDGSIDLLIETAEYVYVVELKYDGSAEEALCQIEEKEYALRFSADSRKVFKVGVNFSSENRRIEDWKIES